MPRSEVWKVVPSSPQFLASSWGRVRMVPYEVRMLSGGFRTYGGKPTYGTWDGSRFVICRTGRHYKISRLVCEAFHGAAPVDKPYCLHKDENARNNRPGNLKWGTQKENLNAPGFIKHCKSRTGLNNPYVKGLMRREKAA